MTYFAKGRTRSTSENILTVQTVKMYSFLQTEEQKFRKNHLKFFWNI